MVLVRQLRMSLRRKFQATQRVGKTELQNSTMLRCEMNCHNDMVESAELYPHNKLTSNLEIYELPETTQTLSENKEIALEK